MQGGLINIVAYHGGALGDFVLFLHFLAGLRRPRPAAKLTVVARSPLLSWALAHGAADVGFDLDSPAQSHLFSDQRPNRPANPAAPADLVISFLGQAGDPFHRNLQAWHGAPVITIDPRPDSGQPHTHILTQWRDRAFAQGVSAASIEIWQPRLDARSRNEARTRLLRTYGLDDRPWTILHPGSGSRRKCAPLEWWLDTARRECRERQILWMIGPDEMERDGPPQMIATLERLAPVIYEESLIRAADIVAAADAFLGHDAGMSHLAAACGLHTTVYFGPTNPAVWAPRGNRVEVRFLRDSEG